MTATSQLPATPTAATPAAAVPRPPLTQEDIARMTLEMSIATVGGFENSWRVAQALSLSTMIPAIYRGSPANCLVALDMKQRIGASILAVMQNLHIVNDKPGWGGSFLIASTNQCGRFTALRFEFRGSEGAKDRACRAWAIEKETGDRLDGAWITWPMVDGEGWSKKTGSKWLTMPEQMFMYRAAAFWVRTHAPEIAMGLQTVDEIEDVIDVGDVTPPAPSGPRRTRTEEVKARLGLVSSANGNGNGEDHDAAAPADETAGASDEPADANGSASAAPAADTEDAPAPPEANPDDPKTWPRRRLLDGISAYTAKTSRHGKACEKWVNEQKAAAQVTTLGAFNDDQIRDLYSRLVDFANSLAGS